MMAEGSARSRELRSGRVWLGAPEAPTWPIFGPAKPGLGGKGGWGASLPLGAAVSQRLPPGPGRALHRSNAGRPQQAPQPRLRGWAQRSLFPPIPEAGGLRSRCRQRPLEGSFLPPLAANAATNPPQTHPSSLCFCPHGASLLGVSVSVSLTSDVGFKAPDSIGQDLSFTGARVQRPTSTVTAGTRTRPEHTPAPQASLVLKAASHRRVRLLVTSVPSAASCHPLAPVRALCLQPSSRAPPPHLFSCPNPTLRLSCRTVPSCQVLLLPAPGQEVKVTHRRCHLLTLRFRPHPQPQSLTLMPTPTPAPTSSKPPCPPTLHPRPPCSPPSERPVRSAETALLALWLLEPGGCPGTRNPSCHQWRQKPQ
ncbi:mucin-7-like isoform X1 [Meles meles]|uniref:mucin-7-like isoform X1 n=1 Tax=Meles meles TaxID=9662 RepID=UPI001E69F7C9|nr:mucin-7-like isoform X1 [Meles meles]